METFDTNVVLRMVYRDDPVQADRASLAWQAAVASGGIFLTTVVLVELAWVLRVAATMLGVDELAGAGDPFFVAFAQMRSLENLKVLFSHDEIYVDGYAPVAILVQRERADDGVRQTLRLEDARQSVEG